MLICRFASAFDVNCHGVVKVLKAHRLCALIPVRTKGEISDSKKPSPKLFKMCDFLCVKIRDMCVTAKEAAEL